MTRANHAHAPSLPRVRTNQRRQFLQTIRPHHRPRRAPHRGRPVMPAPNTSGSHRYTCLSEKAFPLTTICGDLAHHLAVLDECEMRKTFADFAGFGATHK